MVEKTKLNVFDLKKASLSNPTRQAKLEIRKAMGEHFGIELSSNKEGTDLFGLQVIKDKTNAEQLAVEGKLFTKSQAVELGLIKDVI